MESKKCSTCNEVKSVTEFHKNKNNRDGYHNQCKLCRQENSLKNKDKISEYNKKYYQKNKDIINEQSKDYNKNNKKKLSEQNKKYRENNTEKIKIKRLEWEEKNMCKIKKYQNDWRENNKQYILDYSKKYRGENKDKINEYYKLKYNNDPLFKLKQNIRNRIRGSFNIYGYTKKSRTHDILGCSYEQLKNHIESQFEGWMSWENKGNPEDGILDLNKTWDIDHIIPLSSAETEEDVIKLNHYTNLQPLCSYHNRFIKKDIK